MDVLFINPPREVAQKADFPPIGLQYLSSALKASGYSSRVVDASAFSFQDVEEVLAKYSPEVVGVPCWTLERGRALATMELARNVLPEAKVIAGGHHATAMPSHILTRTQADAVVLGEGEITIVDLVGRLLAGGDISDLQGIAFLSDGNVQINPPGDFISDLDTVSYPDYEGIDLDDYLGLPEVDGRAAAVMTSRGCPHACVFCSASKFWKRKWRSRSAENVLGELEFLYAEHNVRNFIFFDDNFTVKKSRAIEICKGILDRGLAINWATSSHSTHVDEEMLEWMKKSGCFRVDFGVESGSPKVLANLNKNQSIEQVERAFALCHEVGIKPRAFLIVGSPGESAETIEETVALMHRIRPYDSRTAGIMWVLPDTQIYEIAKERGLLTDDWWLDHDDMIHYTCEHSYDELVELKDKLMYEMAKDEGSLKAAIEYLARKAYYKYPVLQKLRRFRKVFK